MSYISELWWWFEAQNIQFQFVFTLAFLLIVTSLVLILTVWRLRNARLRALHFSEKLITEIEPVILELIYEDDERVWEYSIVELRTKLNITMFQFHSYARTSDYLVRLHKQLEGEAAERIEQIYRKIGLQEKTLLLLKEAPWHQKVKALSSLSEFRIKTALFEVIQFMDHKNRLVRDEAQFAAIVLGGKKAVKSIGGLTFEISKWQQLRLIEECEHLGDTIKTEVFSWLQAKNESLIELALRICNRMGWYEVLFSVPMLISHKKEEIRVLCVSSVRLMGSEELISNLMHRFEVESRAVQLEIIKAIEELDYQGKMNDFLVSQIIYGDLDLALQAARSFSANASEEQISVAQSELPEERVQILEHVKYA